MLRIPLTSQEKGKPCSTPDEIFTGEIYMLWRTPGIKGEKQRGVEQQ